VIGLRYRDVRSHVHCPFEATDAVLLKALIFPSFQSGPLLSCFLLWSSTAFYIPPSSLPKLTSTFRWSLATPHLTLSTIFQFLETRITSRPHLYNPVLGPNGLIHNRAYIWIRFPGTRPPLLLACFAYSSNPNLEAVNPNIGTFLPNHRALRSRR
jgi:hypothetical protein